jgi:hypothetical protein
MMARKLRVYSVNYDGKERRLVAATSRTAAAMACGVSLYYAKTYMSETFNAEDITNAMRVPGVALRQKYQRGAPYEEVS